MNQPDEHFENLTVIGVDELTPDPDNARHHSERNIDAIAASLDEFGQRTPLVVQKSDGELIVRKGNGTLQAARSLGWNQIVVIVVEEPDHLARAYAIADNRSGELAGWNEDKLEQILDELNREHVDAFEMTGFLEEELADLQNDWDIEPEDLDEIEDYDEEQETYQIRIKDIRHADRDRVVELVEDLLRQHDIEGWEISVY